LESTAYIRTTPRPDPELEDDESVSCYTYIYEDRVVHIWEASEYEYPEQEEEDEIARAKIIWERLKPASDWFYCHLDGTRIGEGEVIPHHAHIIIGLRDEVDPEWWHKATAISAVPPAHWLDDEEESVPEVAHSADLAPARLVQPGATVQTCGDKDTRDNQNEAKDIERGKLSSCTAELTNPTAGNRSFEHPVETGGTERPQELDDNLRSELSTLRNSIPNTLQAIITFERQSVQMFFSPENALEDFRRKVKELWNIPKKSYYLLINGKYEASTPKFWPALSSVKVSIRGLLGGDRGYRHPEIMYITMGNEESMACNRFLSFQDALANWNIECEAPRVVETHTGYVFSIHEEIAEYFDQDDEITLRWARDDELCPEEEDAQENPEDYPEEYPKDPDDDRDQWENQEEEETLEENDFTSNGSDGTTLEEEEDCDAESSNTEDQDDPGGDNVDSLSPTSTSIGHDLPKPENGKVPGINPKTIESPPGVTPVQSDSLEPRSVQKLILDDKDTKSNADDVPYTVQLEDTKPITHSVTIPVGNENPKSDTLEIEHRQSHSAEPSGSAHAGMARVHEVSIAATEQSSLSEKGFGLYKTSGLCPIKVGKGVQHSSRNTSSTPNDQRRSLVLDPDRSTTEESLRSLKEEITQLKQDERPLSALVSLGKDTRQIFFEEHNAVQRLIQKINEIWNIPRKLYWLSVNGIHESQITSWPKTSNVEIKIRGLGAGDSARICMEGIVTDETRRRTFEDILYDKARGTEDDIDQIWLTDRERVKIEKKLKWRVQYSTKKIYIFDRVLPCDPKILKRRAIGKVRLKLEDRILETWNNTSFEAALKSQNTQLTSQFLEIPEFGVSIDTKKVWVRLFALACVEKPLELIWDTRIQGELDSGSLPKSRDGIYIRRDLDPDSVQGKFIKHFQKSKKIDWTIILGEDEQEQEKFKMSGEWVARFDGIRFTYEEPDEPPPPPPPKKTAEEIRKECLLEDGSIDYARIAKYIDADPNFVNPFLSEDTIYAGRLDLRTRVRDTLPDPVPEPKETVSPPPTKERDWLLAGPPIIPEPEPEQADPLPEKFWKEAEELDDSCRAPLQLPATPAKKKRNQARRLRREGTRKRLELEQIKNQERWERTRIREEKRKQRRLTPKPPPKKPFPEDPVRVPLQNGHWRLLRHSDVRNYVIRHFPKLIRRVWVQPCWLGVCSPRKFLNQQDKRDVLQFMRCAIKIQSEEHKDWVQEFIENPYFLRPQQLPSGRVTPEVAINWKAEDLVESSKGTKQWTSVSEKIKCRHKTGHDRFKQWKKVLKENKIGDEISYLTVNCDFQDTVEYMPKRQLRRLPERGLVYVECSSGLPIQGPKTRDEVEDEEIATQASKKYFSGNHQQPKLSTPETQKWLPWTPRPEDEDEIPEKDRVPVRVQIRETGELLDWVLRKGKEWPDFKHMVNARLGHDEWDAWFEDQQWSGETSSGRLTKPKMNQEIRVVPIGFLGGNGLTSVVKKGITKWFTPAGKEVPLPPSTFVSKNIHLQQRRSQAWELISEANIPISDWDTDISLQEHFRSLGNKFVGAEIPNKSGCYLNVQLPEESEWAYFVSMIDNLLGEDNWIAVIANDLGISPWVSADRSPRRNQKVRLFYTDEQQLKDQLQRLEEKFDPKPFVWDCPGVDSEETFEEEPKEDTRDDRVEVTPSTKTRTKKTVPSSSKSWSQLPWYKLEEAFEIPVEGNPVRKKKRKKIPFTLSLSDAYNLGMGGTLIPLQQMLIWGIRTPLSQSDILLKAADAKNEERKQRTERFNDAKSSLFTWLNSDSYKKTRLIKQQIKEGIPYFPPPSIELAPFPAESIQTSRYVKNVAFFRPGDLLMKWLYPVPWVDPEIKEARETLDKEWSDEYTWDILSRKVEIAWRLIREKGGAYHKKLLQFWNQEMDENPYADVLEERHLADFNQAINWAVQTQWKVIILRNLPDLRRKNPAIDYELALLNYYNKEINQEERTRRALTLERQACHQAYKECNAWALVPVREGWHEEPDPYRLLPDDWLESIQESWEAVTPALEKLHQRSAEKRKATFESYYQLELQSWRERFTSELREFKKQDRRFNHLTPESLLENRKKWMDKRISWGNDRASELRRAKVEGQEREEEIKKHWNQVMNEAARTGKLPPYNFEAQTQRKVQANAKRTQDEIQEITQKWLKFLDRIKASLKSFDEAEKWLRIKDETLLGIKQKFATELGHLKQLQQYEQKVLFHQPRPIEYSHPIAPAARPDLNQAIAKALQFHSEKTSLADPPFSKGYGDSSEIESTRSEKSRSKDWNLLGTRGTEAIQMSSHRGPPTDRPPDKPPPDETSPADRPFMKGYGDYSENTRSEKSRSKDWDLLGSRGTKAIQMSSHRGPPTDRPPDKPPPDRSVLAGCSQERANTHRTSSRQALSLRSSSCLRGIVSSLAANAILGSHIAIIQRAARHAVGSSQGRKSPRTKSPNTHSASRAGCLRSKGGSRCDRIRVLRKATLPGTRVIFPPRRFFALRRFSGFNGPAWLGYPPLTGGTGVH
jgi:hypothetical protein